MRTFRLTIKMNNAAFDNHECAECSRILRVVANALDDGNMPAPGPAGTSLFDVNGNKIGRFWVAA